MEKANKFARISLIIEAIAVCNLILSMLTEVSFEEARAVVIG